MLSAETRDQYKRMTPAERLRLAFDLIEEGRPYLAFGTPEQIERKRKRLEQQNDLANQRILAALVKTIRN